MANRNLQHTDLWEVVASSCLIGHYYPHVNRRGRLKPRRIEVSYALDDAGSSDHSPTRCSPTARLCVTQTLGGE